MSELHRVFLCLVFSCLPELYGRRRTAVVIIVNPVIVDAEHNCGSFCLDVAHVVKVEERSKLRRWRRACPPLVPGKRN